MTNPELPLLIDDFLHLVNKTIVLITHDINYSVRYNGGKNRIYSSDSTGGFW